MTASPLATGQPSPPAATLSPAPPATGPPATAPPTNAGSTAAAAAAPPSTPTPGGSTVSRRRVLAGIGVIGAAGLVGAGATLRSRDRGAAASTPSVRPGRGIAVLVTLYGGNDGLNTVVPATDPAYVSGRPTLGYHAAEVLPLSGGVGLNPKLTGFKKRWDTGQLAIVQGVGYPDPSLSHFQSMDIWQTAVSAGIGAGWLGRWLDATGSDPLRAVSVGAGLPPALRGDRSAATAITSDTIHLPGRAPLLAGFSACSQPGVDRSPLAASVAGSGADLLRVRSTLATLTGASPAASPPSPQIPTGKTPTGQQRPTGRQTLTGQLQTVATLINSGAPTQVYQVSLSSFDTHAQEKDNHERLLTELDAGVDSFLTAVGAGPHASDVVVFTVSEFGRRVAENASGGTDHGTAGPVFVAGHGVRGGKLYGAAPSLTALDSTGNLRYEVDFRSVYATVLERVIGFDPRQVLGSSYPMLDFV